ncbi:MAG: HAMP domain-containing sensor histidine kinase [Pseudomonadota bacterium]
MGVSQPNIAGARRGAPKQSAFQRYFWRAGVFHPLTATFRDRKIEAEYQSHLVNEVFQRESAIAYGFVLIYALFGFLDLFVAGAAAQKILFYRLVVFTPIFVGIVSLARLERFKSHCHYIYTLAIFLAATSIVWMIGELPPQNPPPYMVGIIVVFIFAACILHLPFPAAAAAYLATAAFFSATTILVSDYSKNDIIAGHFFLFSSVLLAIGTTFVQEIRSRILWRQDVLRAQDAEKIEELLIEATAADQSKLNFLSILSHELRTPLHQIVGFSGLVRQSFDEDQNDSTHQYLDEINDSASRLLGSIAKMLRYADATAGKISYSPSSCSASYLVETVIDQVSKDAEERDVALQRDQLSKASLAIDEIHTSYALSQILENAVAASPEGGAVMIIGSVVGNTYQLDVSDNGAGMSDQQIDQAFKPFSQTGNARTRAVEGIGLGLSIAKKILNDQGAALDIRSTLGAGTTVTIEFPLAPSKDKISSEAA